MLIMFLWLLVYTTDIDLKDVFGKLVFLIQSVSVLMSPWDSAPERQQHSEMIKIILKKILFKANDILKTR